MSRYSFLFKRRTIFILLPLVLLLVELPGFAHADQSIVSDLVTLVKCSTQPLDCTLSGIGYAIFSMVGVFLAIIAWLFNIVVVNTVFGFANLFGNSAGLLAGWGVLRDVSNIALIFGFVFMGIATILDIHGYEVKKTLPRLVIFAVLLNFSLLASEAIIDGSNLFSSILYQQSVDRSGDVCPTDKSGVSGNCDTNIGIAGAIIGGTKTGTLLHPDFNVDTGLTVYLGLTLLETILMVVLLAGALLLLVRAVVLVFLMVLSPIGFAGLAVPFLEPYAKKWWDALLSQSFFAPVFLLLIFIGLKIGSTLDTGSGSLADTFSGGTVDSINSLFIFALVVGFMIAALMAAKQLGAYGASAVTGFATKAVSYPFAFVGRNTAGLAGHYASKVYNEKAGSIAKRYSALAPTTGLGKAAKWIGGRLGENIDSGIHSGLEAPANAKIGGFASYNEVQKQIKERGKETAVAAETSELKAALKANNADLAAKLAQQMNLHGLEETIKGCNGQQLDALSKVLSPEKFEKVMDSKEISETARERMAHARFANVTRDNVKDQTAKDLVQLAKSNDTQFRELLTDTDNTGKSYLKEEQLEALKKNEYLTAPQRQIVKESTAAGRVENWYNDDSVISSSDSRKRSDVAKTILTNMTAEKKMEIKTEVLIGKDSDKDDLGLAPTLSWRDMQVALAKNKFSDPQLAKLLRVLENNYKKDPEKWGEFMKNDRFTRTAIGWIKPLPNDIVAQPRPEDIGL